MIVTQRIALYRKNVKPPATRRRLPVAAVLAVLTVLLLFAAIGSLTLFSAALLRRLAEQQAVAYAELAGRAAREMVQRSEHELLAAAGVLADRPTLDRLVRERDGAAMHEFLARFCAPGAHSACAVVTSGGVLAASSPDFRPPAGPPLGISAEIAPGGDARMLAAVPLPGHAGHIAIVARDIDRAFTDTLAAHIGVPVRVAALPGTAPRAARHGDSFRAFVPLSDHAAAGLQLEVMLPANSIDATLRSLLRSLLLAAAIAALLAAALATAIGRVISRPLATLAFAAHRIGRGDLSTPVPAVPGAEAAHLRASMDDMRRRLLEVTARLRRSEADAQALLAGMVEGVFAVDDERRIRYLNPQAATLLGLNADDVLGAFCGDVLRPEPVDGVRPCDGPCPIVHARSRGSTRTTEFVHLADGRRRVVVITSSAPSEGRQVQVLRDETLIEGARRARDAIVANVSHEFRTPLSAQLASLEMLRGMVNGEPDNGQGELIRSVERSSLRLVQLVDNLLESVRLESGEDSIRDGVVRIDEVVDDAIELLAPLLQQRAQSVQMDVSHPPASIRGDLQRLTQVVVNLVANASKYAAEGTTITISAKSEADQILLSVTDEGPGLPPDSEDSIFERFQRAGAPDPGGMGLGLWIVKSIVERHGGRVSAMSLPERGARFNVYLPSARNA